MINIFPIVSIISWVLLFLLFVKVSLFSTFSISQYLLHKKNRKRLNKKYLPEVSVLVPCYNEALTIENCVKSLKRQNYKNIEIILINDGSTDNTGSVCKKLSLKYKKVRCFSKSNAGKASALNFGLANAKGEIVICMDADSVFLKDSVRQLVLSFYDKKVIAVGGNVKVINRKKFISKLQAVEYITGLNLQRRTFSYINCMQVISGAIGAFRKKELMEIGGYSSSSIVEDMDVTVSLARAGHKIIYNGNAIAYTEAPENISDFIKQRYRWCFGGFQVLQKHKELFFNKKHGNIGLIGLPYFLFFPFMDILISILFLFTLWSVLIVGGFQYLLLFFIFMSILQAFLISLSIYMDKESKKLALMAGFDSIWYNHLISTIYLISAINFLRGGSTQWNKMPRLGRNILLYR